ncbi:MAG TPA: SLBB domain-containing protein [Acidobacteriaceae bacterium]|nr:SLBB domain-containing protein [Acidobacteriaceae bacterium]
MRKQLVFGLGIVFAVLSPHAMAQSTTGLQGGRYSNQATDCSDPLLANSAECQTTQQQGGYMPQVNLPRNSAPLPQPGMVQPPTYVDTGANQYSLQSRYRNSPNIVRLPPQPLTEFQKFVAGTTGQVLPIFGANLFQNAPSTFAPVDEAPVPPDYVIGPGDELRIRIWGQVNFNANVRVDRTGNIYLPQVGQVHVAGLPYQALSEHLHAAVGRVFRNFDLTADIGQIRAVQVYVVGQAQRPGTYTISSLSTLVDALFASGGPSVDGSMRHIYLKRGGKTVADFDLYDLLVHGDKSHDTTLQSGDVIFIPPVGPQVALTGSVRQPGIYELRDHETSIEQLLQYAGGASATASDARISIERIAEHRDRTAMEVAFDQKGLATTLQQGDVLRVFSILPMYQKTVTLRGNTANPGRFAWHKGMRLSDLIPDRDSLLTRDYWWKRARAGLPSPAFEPVPALAARTQPVHPFELPRRNPSLSAECQKLDQTNPASSALQQRCNAENTQEANGYGMGAGAYGSTYGANNPNAPSSAGNAGLNGSISQGTANRDLVGAGTIAERENGVVTENTAGAMHHLRVTLPAPEIDWHYAVIERLDKDTLKTSLVPFDLGKLVLDHDPSQNLELQPGDIVTIFSQADIHVPLAQQTKFVRLEGEFVHAGTYSVKPGETLPELVARAGGFSADAYLYGSEFTRQSTRAIQQQRINDYVRNLQMEISRGSIAQSSSAVASAQDLASANAATTSERELIAQLQQLRATGRIVLEVKPKSSGIAALPPIQLEDGDTFVVPPRPASVNVVGAVYDQSSFLFVPGRRVGDYLHLAGGPNRDADKKHAFIIRADGSVISRAAANGIWGNGFNSLTMNPGDTIVVPEKTYGPSLMRGFLEWSQLFSQLALGAAAVSIIRP